VSSIPTRCGGCPRRLYMAFLILGVAFMWCIKTASADDCNGYTGHYCKIYEPPDVEKAGGPGSDLTCWLATAANMLAGAGYGEGSSVQARAEEIYAELKTEFGVLE